MTDLRLPWHRETVGHKNVKKIAAKVAAELAVPLDEGIPANTDATWIINADGQVVAFVGNGPRQTDNADAIIEAVAAATTDEPGLRAALESVIHAWRGSTVHGEQMRALQQARAALAATPAASDEPYCPDCGGPEKPEDHRAPAASDGSLDVRRVVQAITNIAVRHGLTKEPPPYPPPLATIYGYSRATPDMDAEIAAEYARLSESPSEGRTE